MSSVSAFLTSKVLIVLLCWTVFSRVFVEQQVWKIEKMSPSRINNAHSYMFSKDNVYLWSTRQAYILPIIEYLDALRSSSSSVTQSTECAGRTWSFLHHIVGIRAQGSSARKWYFSSSYQYELKSFVFESESFCLMLSASTH